MSAVLKSIFFARDVHPGQSGVDITDAFITGSGATSFPSTHTFWLIGEFKFSADDFGDHTFDAACSRMVETKTAEPPPSLVSTSADHFEAHTYTPLRDGTGDVAFQVLIVVFALEPGEYIVELLLDGKGQCKLPFLIAHMPSAPDDLSELEPPNEN